MTVTQTTAQQQAPAKKKAEKKTTAKKLTSKKTAAKRATAKKPAGKKATAKKKATNAKGATAKKVTNARSATAKKATLARSATAKKTATNARSATAKKTATNVRSATAKKATATKKASKNKATSRNTAAKKTAKKPAARKPSSAGMAAEISAISARAAAQGVVLPKGASATEIAQAEKALGFALPDEVRAWYAAHDGGGDDYVLEHREFLSLAHIVGQWKIWKRLLDDGTFGANDHGAPGKGVQKKWWIAEWVPVTYDGAGNHHVIDLAPAPGGTPGQVLSFWHDDSPRTVVAASFLRWLAKAEWTPSQ